MKVSYTNDDYYYLEVDGIRVSRFREKKELYEYIYNHPEYQDPVLSIRVIQPDIRIEYQAETVEEPIVEVFDSIPNTTTVGGANDPPFGATVAAAYNFDSTEETTDPDMVARVRWNTGTEDWDILDTGSGGPPFTNTARTTDSWDSSNCVRWTYTADGSPTEYNAGNYYEVHPLQLQGVYSVRYICRWGSAFYPSTTEAYKSWFLSVYQTAGPFPDRDHGVTPTGYEENCCSLTERCPSLSSNPGGSGGGSLPDGWGCANPVAIDDYAGQWLCIELLHDMSNTIYYSIWDRSGVIDLPSYPGNIDYISAPCLLSSSTSHYLSHFRLFPVVNNTDAINESLDSNANAYWDIDSISFSQITAANISSGIYLQGPPAGFVTG